MNTTDDTGELRRRTRWSLVLAGLALGVSGLAFTGLLGGGQGESVSASEYVLVDSAGDRRASLGLRENGPALVLRANDGPQLALEAGESGSGIYLQDAGGATRIQLSLRDGQPAVSLLDDSGRPRWIGAVTDRGNGVVRWMDSTGAVRLAVGSDGEAGYSVQLYDEEGRNRATLAVDPEGAGFGLFGPGGRLLFP